MKTYRERRREWEWNPENWRRRWRGSLKLVASGGRRHVVREEGWIFDLRMRNRQWCWYYTTNKSIPPVFILYTTDYPEKEISNFFSRYFLSTGMENSPYFIILNFLKSIIYFSILPFKIYFRKMLYRTRRDEIRLLIG